MSTAPNGYVYGGGDDGPSSEIMIRADEIATRRGCPISHVALAWINKRVTAPIIGFSSIERIDEALAARGLELTTEEEKFLEEPYRPRDILGHE
nr:aldo-keto reductase dtxs3 [Quercus suber]